jgi:carboxymethylenebutenolidase
MSDTVLIQPQRSELSAGVPALVIRLGGTQRGLIIVLSDEATPEVEVVEAMNMMAGEGFESLALLAAEGSAVLAEAHARACGWVADQIGVVGIGGGATVALEMARSRRLGAVVSLSPSPDLADVSSAPILRTPWLGLFGSQAEDLAHGGIGRLCRVLDEGSDVYSQVVVYPGVGADFHRRSDDGISFAASYDAWQRTVEFLLARVASRLTPLAIAWRERHGAS